MCRLPKYMLRTTNNSHTHFFRNRLNLPLLCSLYHHYQTIPTALKPLNHLISYYTSSSHHLLSSPLLQLSLSVKLNFIPKSVLHTSNRSSGVLQPKLKMTGLSKRVFTLHKEALASGHLIYYQAETILIKTGINNEIPYQIRYIPALSKKPVANKAQSPTSPKDYRAQPQFNPFLPCQPELLVSGDMFHKHNIVLNKFCVIPGHILLTTKDFQSQKDPLSVDDFQALVKAMEEFSPTRTLGFFNCGELSGASQPHKHVQLVPLDDQEPPIHHFLTSALQGQPLDQSLSLKELPYAHRVAKLSQLGDGAKVHQLYCTMLRELGPELAAHHNLTLFDNYMYLLPRAKEGFNAEEEEFSINSLGSVHMVLAKSSAQIDALKKSLMASSSCNGPWVGQLVGWPKV